MLAAQARGHAVHYVPPRAIELEQDRVVLRARRAHVEPAQGHHFRLEPEARLAARDCAAVFLRTDPPVDVAYLETTWLLSFAEREGVLVINRPGAVRAANEKLYALEFAGLCPPTAVTTSLATVRAFMAAQGGEVVVKPLDGHGGFGVLRLREGDSNVNGIVELLTLEGRRPLLVQRYLPEGAQGDRRLHVVDGELRGVVRRVPRAGDHRGNVHVGGHVEACEPTDGDRALVGAMAARLRADGLFFVGLDVIAGKLIEVNVTSPTLLQELRRLGGPDVAAEIIAAVEGRAASRG
jgi:glutathione synthase